jgi:3-hydroxyisobutyrate dehydrogenase-like beta-hydroxyacid dehydrogenase
MKIGFIGLGNMGQSMARNLLHAGHDLIVYNRTRSRAEGLRPAGARVARLPAAAAREAEVLITMLADDRAVQQVMFGAGVDRAAEEADGALTALSHAIHLSMSTIGVEPSGRLAQAQSVADKDTLPHPFSADQRRQRKGYCASRWQAQPIRSSVVTPCWRP